MKTTTQLLLIFLVSFAISTVVAFAQTPQLQWIKQFGGVNSGRPTSVVVDGSGNIYTMGHFTGSFDCDPGEETFLINSKINTNTFITKIDASGNLIWAKSIEDTGTVYGNSIILDKSGNFYITGYFGGTADFDLGDSVYNLTNVNTDGVSIFIAKYDTSGSMKWAKNMEGSGYGTGASSVALDKTGNVYTCGVFGGKVDFDPGDGTYILNRQNGTNLFILKLDNSGNFKWVKQFEIIGPQGFNSIYSIAIDGFSNIYTTGIFAYTTDFDPGEKKFYLTPTEPGFCSSFVSKLDSLGNFISASSFNGKSYHTFVSGLVVDNSNNVYITGSFSYETDFNPGTGSLILTSSGSEDAFIVKWDSSGKFPWAKKIGGLQNDKGQSIGVDKYGNIYVSGIFTETVDFDPGTKVKPLTSGTYSNGYIVKLDANGSYLWAQQLGPSFNHCLYVDSMGTIYVAGSLGAVGDYDPGSGTIFLSPENGGVFIDKIKEVQVLDVSEPSISLPFSIYPNPSTNSLTINFNKQATNARIKLINLLGQTLFEQSDVNGTSLSMDISSQPKGMYFVEVHDGGNVERMKVIKE